MKFNVFKWNLQGLFPLIALVIVILALSLQLGKVPPMGVLLNPFLGAVQNNGGGRLGAGVDIPHSGVSKGVSVYFDEREVPHIFAANTADLFFAQGYVTASLRLWQMDFLSYVSAGRLAEIFGQDYVDYDRNQRRMGMLSAAEASLSLIEKDKEAIAALDAYTRGVNAYVGRLNIREYPLEYKVLDYQPEPWTNLKTVLILKYMAATLTGYEDDLNMSQLMLALGEDRFNALFPSFQKHTSPVVGGALGFADTTFRLKKPAYLDYSFLSAGQAVQPSSYNPSLGSNSWAVSGEKTESGYPILANDPHLGLSLPSIWVEMQLTAPGVNVYGVAIPGTPAVLIGFNEDIAWGITNGADDVRDYYKLTIREDYKQYLFDGKWVDLPYRIEEIKRRGQRPLYDTVYQTVQGPVVSDKRFPGRRPELMNYALRWQLHEASDEFLCFIRLNKAKNYQDYRDAIRYCSCPAQNFTFACKDNTIAITHQGKLAVKWPGQGRFVLDGSTSTHLYKKFIPEDSLPYLLNPASHFVVSANQQPTRAGYPYYYNGYYSETRANRIRQLLERQSRFTLAKTEAMQLDNVNSFAVDALPLLVEYLKASAGEKGAGTGVRVGGVGLKKLIDSSEMARSIGRWDGSYGQEDYNASLFDLWWHFIKEYAWSGLRRFPFSARLDDYILLDMLRDDPQNIRWDRLETPEKETAGDLVRLAFVTAADSCRRLADKGQLNWGKRHKVNLMHLTNMPGFSWMGQSASGCPDAINAVSANWGPSWRMVVQLGRRPVAAGIYAGGQSGDPGSSHYDDFVEPWKKGKYFPLSFFLGSREASEVCGRTLSLH